MQKNPLIYLHDITESIDLIEQYIGDVSLSQFTERVDVQDKVLRRLEIIAEATKRLPEEIRAKNSQVPWKSIIGLRNIITHTYDEVNLTEIWEIITVHLPKTKKQIEEIQSSLNPSTQ